MKILITGSRGFVARGFGRFFSGQGHDITRVDIVGACGKPCGDCGTDVRDFFRADDTRYDLVVHLAAVVGGRTMIDGEPLKVATDLAIDSDMFQWALRTRPGRIVYYSSSAAYPVDLQNDLAFPGLLSERDITLTGNIGRPDQTYGWAKLTGEMLAEHARDAGLKVHVFRPFSGYGRDQDPSYPFRAFADRALRRADPFDIWGDGQQVRDFVHIDDVVAATMTAVDQDVQGPTNLCTGVGTSFLELAGEFVKAVDTRYAPEFALQADKPVGVAHRVGDPTKMLSFYTPKISLQQGIDSVFA